MIKDQVLKFNAELENKVIQKESGSKNKKTVSSIYELINEKTNKIDQKDIKKILNSFSKFHKYSTNNKLLIHFQSNGKAKKVAGFDSWQKINKKVKTGEKAIKILAPRFFIKEVEKTDNKGNYIKDKEGNIKTKKKKINYLTTVSVFDISQTEGDPLPEFEIEIKDHLSDFKKPLLKVANDNNIKINLKSKEAKEQILELTEIIAKKKSKDISKIELEAIKYIVAKKYELDYKLNDQVLSLANDKNIKTKLDRTGNISKLILDEVENYHTLKLSKEKIKRKQNLIKNLKENINGIDETAKNSGLRNKNDVNFVKNIFEIRIEIERKLENLNEKKINEKSKKINKKYNNYIKNIKTIRNKSPKISR